MYGRSSHRPGSDRAPGRAGRGPSNPAHWSSTREDRRRRSVTLSKTLIRPLFSVTNARPPASNRTLVGVPGPPKTNVSWKPVARVSSSAAASARERAPGFVVAVVPSTQAPSAVTGAGPNSVVGSQVVAGACASTGAGAASRGDRQGDDHQRRRREEGREDGDAVGGVRTIAARSWVGPIQRWRRACQGHPGPDGSLPSNSGCNGSTRRHAA